MDRDSNQPLKKRKTTVLDKMKTALNKMGIYGLDDEVLKGILVHTGNVDAAIQYILNGGGKNRKSKKLIKTTRKHRGIIQRGGKVGNPLLSLVKNRLTLGYSFA